MAFLSRVSTNFRNYMQERQNSQWGMFGGVLGAAFFTCAAVMFASVPVALIGFLILSAPPLAAAIAATAVCTAVTFAWYMTPFQYKQAAKAMAEKFGESLLGVSFGLGQVISLVLEWTTKPLSFLVLGCLKLFVNAQDDTSSEGTAVELAVPRELESPRPVDLVSAGESTVSIHSALTNNSQSTVSSKSETMHSMPDSSVRRSLELPSESQISPRFCDPDTSEGEKPPHGSDTSEQQKPPYYSEGISWALCP